MSPLHSDDKHTQVDAFSADPTLSRQRRSRTDVRSRSDVSDVLLAIYASLSLSSFSGRPLSGTPGSEWTVRLLLVAGVPRNGAGEERGAEPNEGRRKARAATVASLCHKARRNSALSAACQSPIGQTDVNIG